MYLEIRELQCAIEVRNCTIHVDFSLLSLKLRYSVQRRQDLAQILKKLVLPSSDQSIFIIEDWTRVSEPRCLHTLVTVMGAFSITNRACYGSVRAILHSEIPTRLCSCQVLSQKQSGNHGNTKFCSAW